MASVIGFFSGFVFSGLRTLPRPLYALLTKPDELMLVAFLGHNNMRLGLVTRSPLGLVDATEAKLLHLVFYALWSSHYTTLPFMTKRM